MPAKWQQWMPFKIDAFRGSPAVQAMHPSARSGYLYLLTAQWQTDDCAIESDPISLADASGLGDELWAIHGPRILRNFITLENGELRNLICYEEWLKAKTVFEQNEAHRLEVSAKRAEAARIANEKRWGHKKDGLGQSGSQTDPKPDPTTPKSDPKLSQNDPYTGTGTGTGTEDQKTIAPSDSRSELDPPKVLGRLPLNDKTDFEITDRMVQEWSELYPAVDVVQQCKSMKGWCLGNPTKLKTRKGIVRFITSWLDKEQNRGPKPALFDEAKPKSALEGMKFANAGGVN